MEIDGDIIDMVLSIDDNDTGVALMLLSGEAKQRRAPKWAYKRIDWDRHVEMLVHTKSFQSRYHMSLQAFHLLLSILRSSVTVDGKQSRRCTSGNAPIVPELVVGAGLRFLGGESQKSIADIYGISVKSTMRIVDKFLHAVNKHLQIQLPTDEEELETFAMDWDAVSGAGGIYHGVVGAIDGWLCCIDRPSVPSPVDYFSGHYQRFGINIQAVCDSKIRFIYFGVVAPGKTNDLRAFNRCEGLRLWLQSIPSGFFLIGDNAYTLTNSMLIPFSGAEKHETYKRTYNFYLSQLRIRIEMSFGRLTTKWRIFRKNLDFAMEKNALICTAAAKLHNFVIDNDGVNFGPQSAQYSDFGVEPLVMNDGTRNIRGYLSVLNPNPSSATDIGVGARRATILGAIVERDMRRPIHNILRNQELDEESVYEATEE